jgi:hypothetical protein
MALYAAYAGARVVSARVTRPSWGLWSADVLLAQDDAVAATGTLTIGNLALVGAVLPRRDGPFAGSRSVRIVGGMGGWYQNVGARFYAKTQGVRLATVIGDVAAEVGESVALSTAFASNVVGQYWSRAAGQAVNVLSVAVGRSWYVDDAGVTRIGDRPASSITSPFDLTGPGYRGALGMVEIATEDPLSWRPGAVFRSELLPAALTVASATIHMAAEGVLRVEVMIS